MTLSIWLTLLAAATLISLSPGAGAVTAMSYGLSQGVRRAQPAILGLISGYGTQIVVVGVGLGSLVAASVTLFTVIKWIGVGYLVWLGIQKWREKGDFQLGEAKPVHWRRAYLQSLLINITNPKGLVFLVALIPQFLDPHAPQAPQLLIIGTTLVAVDWCVMTGYSLLASRLRAWMRDARARRAQNRVTGSALIGAGLVLSGAQHA
ncbi:homoserine/homoserine lactone efflux protein [Marinobacterium nitratireducens]|uniref:Homoserine/homoserine lactone efflux protein n=1 Tax=Marinobacterium nitratireducens TaxID=518897 RepID=A0A918DSL7_9GAMM|nr:homoserine/homoserine lactone efflux protein [Marinobacterium nitratireducens]GGO82332.1 homoserine/homoserine lactone efflux protein [Marinobacterium nitratireducens]